MKQSYIITRTLLILIASLSLALGQLSLHQQAAIDQVLNRLGEDGMLVVAECNTVNLMDSAAMLTLAASFVPGQGRRFNLLHEESRIGPSQPLVDQFLSSWSAANGNEVVGTGRLICLPARSDCRLPDPHHQVLLYQTEFAFKTNNTFAFAKEERFALLMLFTVPPDAVTLTSFMAQPKDLPTFIQCQSRAAEYLREQSNVVRLFNRQRQGASAGEEDFFMSNLLEKRGNHLANRLEVKSACGPVYTLELFGNWIDGSCPNHGIQNMIYQLRDVFGGVKQVQVSIGVQDTTAPKWKVPLDKRVILCLVFPKRSPTLTQELCPANLIDYLTRYEWAEDNCDLPQELVVLFNKEPIRVDCGTDKQECKLLIAPPSPRKRPQPKKPSASPFQYLRIASNVECYTDLASGNLLRYTVKVSDACMKMAPGELVVDIHMQNNPALCPADSTHYSTELAHLAK